MLIYYAYLYSAGWMYIVNKHGGKLPLLIKAIPEGTVVPTRNGKSHNY